MSASNISKAMQYLWWSSFGMEMPHLKKLAIRILSQTFSATRCKCNWSVFEHIHSKKRNRLEHKMLNDFVYVKYNMKLRQRQVKQLLGCQEGGSIIHSLILSVLII